MTIIQWPVIVFDDDGYPYALPSQQALRAWAEGPETSEEFTAGFDSTGRPLRLAFVDDAPTLYVNDTVDLAALRSFVKKAVMKYANERASPRIDRDIESMPVAELIELIEALYGV